jgi:Bacterial PH domain
MMSFRIAPMSPMIRNLTLVLLALPVAFCLPALFGASLLVGPGILLVALYLWVWLRFRPTRFVVHRHVLEIIWPLKRRQIERATITEVRTIDSGELRGKVGLAVRIGVGGLWGGFGWLWTRRRGIVQMYISRTDGLVWIERVNRRPWLLTPEHPEDFVRALSSASYAPTDKE